MGGVDGAGIAGISGEDSLEGVIDVIVFRGGHELEGLADDGGIAEVNQQFGEIAIGSVITAGIKGFEAGDEFCFNCVGRFAHAGSGEGVGAEPSEELVAGKRLRIEFAEGSEDLLLVGFVPDSCEGDLGFDGGPGTGFGEGFVRPT